MESVLKVALIQAHCYENHTDSNLAYLEELISQLPRADLIVLPEMFNTGFTVNSEGAETLNGKTHKWLKQVAARTQAMVIGSLKIKEADALYNRLLVIRPDGETFQYNKQHLFAFAGEDLIFKSGDIPLLISYKGFNLAFSICFDLRFPEALRRRKSYNYEAMIVCANWPDARISAWDALLKARSIENSAYVIGVNRGGKDYLGNSAVYEPKSSQISSLLFEDLLGSKIFWAELSKDYLQRYRQNFKVEIPK